jgi:O-antigen/teichoic acid export membrane protein
VRRLVRAVAPVLLYVLVPLASALAPLTVIPAIATRFGASGWSAAAIGLSVGVAASVIAELGWAIVGPQRVARNPLEAKALYDSSLGSKAIAVLVVAPVAAVAAGVTVESHQLAAALIAAGVACGALSPAWYFTGLGKPQRILLSETAPRIVAAVVSAWAISHGAGLESYGVGMLAAAGATLAIAARLGAGRVVPSRAALVGAPALVREQAVLIVGRGVSTLYKSLAVSFLGVVNPASVASFAALDRPLRMGLSVLAAVPSRLQAWVAVEEAELARRRRRRAIALNGGVGLVAGTLCFVLMPWVGDLLFVGVVTVDRSLALLGGLLIAVISLSRGLGLALVSAQRADATSWASAASALVGLPGVLVAGSLAGAAGATGALVLAESAGVLVQWFVLARGHSPARLPRIAEAI